MNTPEENKKNILQQLQEGRRPTFLALSSQELQFLLSDIPCYTLNLLFAKPHLQHVPQIEEALLSYLPRIKSSDQLADGLEILDRLVLSPTLLDGHFPSSQLFLLYKELLAPEKNFLLRYWAIKSILNHALLTQRLRPDWEKALPTFFEKGRYRKQWIDLKNWIKLST